VRLHACVWLAGLACCAAALTVAAQEPALSLRLPAEDKVAFRGIASFDGVGPATPAPLYQAPNVASAIVALLTHAVIVDSVGRSTQDQIRESADRVLAPHREALDKLTFRELMQSAMARMTTPGAKQVLEAGDKPPTGLVLESSPVFSMTQDTLAIALDNAIIVRKPGEAEGKSFQIVVRVVSTPQASANWSDDDGMRLKEQSAALLAVSFDTALGAMAQQPPQDAPQRTVRYRLGGEERMERAQVLSERCDRLLIKNLRGWLMSVPAICEQKAAPDPN